MRALLAVLCCLMAAHAVAETSAEAAYDIRCKMRTPEGAETETVFRIDEVPGGVNNLRASFTKAEIVFKLRRANSVGPLTVRIDRATGVLTVYTPTREVINTGVCVRIVEPSAGLTGRSSGLLRVR